MDQKEAKTLSKVQERHYQLETDLALLEKEAKTRADSIKAQAQAQFDEAKKRVEQKHRLLEDDMAELKRRRSLLPSAAVEASPAGASGTISKTSTIKSTPPPPPPPYKSIAKK